jgi:hypothetical protein
MHTEEQARKKICPMTLGRGLGAERCCMASRCAVWTWHFDEIVNVAEVDVERRKAEGWQIRGGKTGHFGPLYQMTRKTDAGFCGLATQAKVAGRPISGMTT